MKYKYNTNIFTADLDIHGKGSYKISRQNR